MGGPADDAIEAEAATESAVLDTLEQAEGDSRVESLDEEGDEAEAEPPAKLERLQKILAQAGIASRRHAEELITQGRVQVNGAVVTALGTKADPSRDHIRVDGKLLQGAERLRYFVLNKPKGFVTTVSDPEGRPTVMQFFGKLRERLYPVGRLDYLSEGLLLVTNDGELANKLTRAASGVEKTYLVKVSGQPSEEALDRLREGVAIDRGRPGSGQVHTVPARIRMMRQADNPWYEVVLTEGRNRELRKMFEEIGHHVEKIRRVGYGPLVLDLEPGKMRELDPEEVQDLRKAAEGKLRPKKAKEMRHAIKAKTQLPPVRPKRERGWQERPPKRAESGRVKPSGRRFQGEESRESREFKPKSRFGGVRPHQRPSPGRAEQLGQESRRDRPESERFDRKSFGKGKPAQERFGRPDRQSQERRTSGPSERTSFDRQRTGAGRQERATSERPRTDGSRFGERGGNRPVTREGRRSGQRREFPSRDAGSSGRWNPNAKTGGRDRSPSGERPEGGPRPSFGSTSGPRAGKAGFGGARSSGPKRGQAGPRSGSGRPKFGSAKRTGSGGERRGGGPGNKGRR
jgi:23S rRNA pseudouridine2605 synthase